MKLPKVLNMGLQNIRQEPLVELWGNHRILIENHLGITGYANDCVHVQLSFGNLCVTGEDLKLSQITKDQLVIHGNILTLQLERR